MAQARLTVSAWLRNNTGAPVECSLSGAIEERTFAQPVTLAPNETREVFFKPEDFKILVVDAPRVWWPHPVGKQELYRLELKAGVQGALSDTAATNFGIRDISTYINEEDWRGYRVNGHNILIRGGAWMTQDMLLNLDTGRYDALVRYAREANLNMLRSEGFSIRETDTFYDLCDQYGVMVTQQIFGRSIPDEKLAIACLEDTLLRIRNHPSLAHFLGHDETFPTDTLDAAYRGLLEKHRIGRAPAPLGHVQHSDARENRRYPHRHAGVVDLRRADPLFLDPGTQVRHRIGFCPIGRHRRHPRGTGQPPPDDAGRQALARDGQRNLVVSHGTAGFDLF